ncbi:MAG: ribonuclease HII [Chlamydiae bacterium]|nr:ribonuclease HII [Chlamydiota bacterium]
MWEEFEKEAISKGFSYPVGIDEAGRGPLAGPVIAAAIYIPPHLEIEGIKDSKELSPKKRRKVYEILLQSKEIDYGIGVSSPQEIDRINILQATFEAMKEAVAKLQVKPDFLLIDGNMGPLVEMKKQLVVQGDKKVRSIAAASILAKEYRDELMAELHLLYPEYNFLKHKGYPTEEHMNALRKYGPSPIHRRSFAPVRELI